MAKISLFLALAIIVGIGAMYFRIISAGHDPEVWHVDPLDFTIQTTPNTYYVAPQAMVHNTVDREAPIYAADAKTMAKALDDFIMTQQQTTRIAGSPREMWMTYVQRTPTLRMPDYISIRLIDLPDGKSTIAVYSRSRYGYGDMGVNKARVELWLNSIASFQE